jgi:hypothetical protein
LYRIRGTPRSNFRHGRVDLHATFTSAGAIFGLFVTRVGSGFKLKE